jgi:hypothetical protein
MMPITALVLPHVMSALFTLKLRETAQAGAIHMFCFKATEA